MEKALSQAQPPAQLSRTSGLQGESDSPDGGTWVTAL